MLGETMPQHVVLATASEQGSDQLLAGALPCLPQRLLKPCSCVSSSHLPCIFTASTCWSAGVRR